MLKVVLTLDICYRHKNRPFIDDIFIYLNSETLYVPMGQFEGTPSLTV